MSIDPKDCTRSDSATAYFEPAKGRPNLHLVTAALAEKMILDTSSKVPKAAGVQIRKDGKSSVLTAQREVILAAGVFGTPKLLELSGIGGKPLLEKLGIPVVVENPNVGENLQDHPSTGVSFEVADGVETMDGLSRQEPEAINAAMQDYINHKKGPLAVGGNFAGSLLPVPGFVKGDGAEALLKRILDETAATHVPGDFTPYHEEFVRSLLSKPSEGVANIFIYAPCGSELPLGVLPTIFALSRTQTSTRSINHKMSVDFVPKGAGSTIISQAADSGNFITVSAVPLFPLSRGYSHINSTDVSAKPTIDPRYMTHPLDVEILARLVAYIDTITKTEPFSKFLKSGGRRSHGAPEDLTDIEQVKAYIKTSTLSCWHPTSTCALLPRERGGVVDPQLQVYGVEGLRIVDSSVIPVQTRGNTQTTVYAVAERAADLIKAHSG